MPRDGAGGERLKELLNRGLKVKGVRAAAVNFSDTGNFGFGISEHIDLGIKYEPQHPRDLRGWTSIRGARPPREPCVEGSGARGRVPPKHRITKKEAIAWFVKKFDGTVFAKKDSGDH
eukprot:Sspe_Gene.324::Locus_114_Transcript_3_3_Confidence_0.500_Length_678::g.324::m.324/K02868/RP-L11e, RPL11; large subunit ribosomal protein L11e